MLIPTIPSNEASRMAALWALAILDTPPEERFDRITRTARRLFGTTMSLITLVEGDRAWFKSAQGIDLTECSRENAFCSLAIAGQGPYVIEDAHTDPRFSDHPLVTGPPHVRFYAGVPVRSPEGFPLGTLCVMDPAPRTFGADDRLALADLAAMAEDELCAIDLNAALIAAEEGQAALHAQASLLDAANAAKSVFLASMSHELRTPLNAIIGFSEILEEDVTEQGQRQFLPDLAKIRGAGKHLLSLIDDILDLSKIEAGKMVIAAEPTDVALLAREVSQTVAPLISKHGNTLEVRISDELPVIETDPTRVRQILFNLLANAAKFTENGRITLTVMVAPTSYPPGLLIRVADTGLGMAPAQLARLFEAFMQADDHIARRFGGTGLGLVLSRRFSQLLGGDISVSSHPGHGSTFSVWLPA